MKDLKVIFMGTPEFCVPILKALIENCNVIAVVTQPDKKVGRHQEISYSPIKKVAIENNIKVMPLIYFQEIDHIFLLLNNKHYKKYFVINYLKHEHPKIQ